MPDPSNHPSFYNDTRGFTVDDDVPTLPPCIICGDPAEDDDAPTCGSYDCYRDLLDGKVMHQ